MLRSAREHGPALLVPLAWTFAAAAHAGALANRTVVIAHVVMCVLLFGFATLSYREMRSGVLKVWWWVVAVGFLLTAGGLAVLLTTGNETLLAAEIAGWMLLPVVGFLVTARTTAPRVYFAAASLSALGTAVYLYGFLTGTGPLAGFALVGVGQTVAIVHAALAY